MNKREWRSSNRTSMLQFILMKRLDHVLGFFLKAVLSFAVCEFFWHRLCGKWGLHGCITAQIIVISMIDLCQGILGDHVLFPVAGHYFELYDWTKLAITWKDIPLLIATKWYYLNDNRLKSDWGHNFLLCQCPLRPSFCTQFVQPILC